MLSHQEQEVIKILRSHLELYHNCLIDRNDTWFEHMCQSYSKVLDPSESDRIDTVRVIKTNDINTLRDNKFLIIRAYVIPPIIIVPEGSLSDYVANELGYTNMPLRIDGDKPLLLFNGYVDKFIINTRWDQDGSIHTITSKNVTSIDQWLLLRDDIVSGINLGHKIIWSNGISWNKH